MDDFMFGLLAIVLGAGVCFLGLRLWFIMLPIWGFVAGFFVGAGAVTAIFGDGFLSTVSGWVVGIVVGLIFALLSYLVWYAGAIIAAGAVGALAGSGLMGAVDVETGWIVFLAAAAGAFLFGLFALASALPVWVVIVGTASSGAAAAIAGVQLVFGRIDLEELERGATWAMIDDSFFWLVVWVVIACLGIFVQVQSIKATVLPDDLWTRAQDFPPPSVAAA